MSEISSLPANIVAWLKERDELKYINFLTEYPAIKKAVPLKNTTVAVGIDTLNIVDSFVENDEGVLVENEYCRQANIRLRLSIHAPFSSGGEACHEAFTDIIDCLTFASGLDIQESGCESIVSDRDTDAFVLTAWATVLASLCPAQTSSVKFPSFLSKDLLCGSHITNEEVHLSQEQQSYLDRPVYCGKYFGLGQMQQNIKVGFKPQAVFVFWPGNPILSCNHETGENISYMGYAFRDGNSPGLELTDEGFKVFVESSEVVEYCKTQLNKAGKTYVFIAVR